MKKNDILLSLLFFITGILSRFPLVEKMQSHRDSPTHTLALIHYSFEQETPVAPGYPLYFGVGKLFMFVTHDPHTALVLVSVIFSGVGAVVFFLVGKSFWNRTTGIIASLLFLSSPAFYYFGLTIYGYLIVAVMTTLIAWCVYQIVFRKKEYGIILGIIYAISLGVRPQELITTFPLFLYGIIMLSRSEKEKTIISFLTTFLFWFVPFMVITGGIVHYIQQSSSAASAGLPIPNLLYFLTKKFELASGFYLTFTAGILILIFFLVKTSIRFLKNKSFTGKDGKKVLFFAAWFLPPSLFNFFIRTEHAGYQMGYLTFFLFLLSFAIWKISKKNKILLISLTTLVIATNLGVFFYNRDPGYVRPYRQSSFHYSDIRRNDYVLSSKVNYIKSHYNPDKTLILVGPVFWRQAMYYLPEYQIYEIDALVTNDYRFMNTRRNARNWIRKEFSTSDFTFLVPSRILNMVLFDDESKYWVKSKKKIIQFKGMTSMTVVPVQEKDLVNYSFESLTIMEKT